MKNELKTIVLENNWLTRGVMDFGWGNGYVLIPEKHKLHGVHHDSIDVDVHGGLTFSCLVDEKMIEDFNLSKEDLGKWCVGFDTCHYADNINNWSKENVEKETERLKLNLLKL